MRTSLGFAVDTREKFAHQIPLLLLRILRREHEDVQLASVKLHIVVTLVCCVIELDEMLRGSDLGTPTSVLPQRYRAHSPLLRTSYRKSTLFTMTQEDTVDESNEIIGSAKVLASTVCITSPPLCTAVLS